MPPPLLLLFPPCAACGTARPGPFCPACGQEAKQEAPVTVRSIFEELLRGLNPMNKAAWRTLRAMPYGPGKVALAFVHGQRKPYSHPFSFFGLSVLYLGLTAATYRSVLDRAVEAEVRATGAEGAALAAALAERQASLDFFLSHQEGYGLLLVLPLAAALAWLVGGRLRLAGWLVAALFSLSLVNVMLGVAKPLVYSLLPFTHATLLVLGVWTSSVLAFTLWTVRDVVPPFPGRMPRAVLAVVVAFVGYGVLRFAVNVGYWLVVLL